MSLLKKNKLVFIFTVVALLAIGVGYGYQYIFMSPKKVVEITPEFTADADEFNTLIDENLPSWIGKVVQITGKATQDDVSCMNYYKKPLKMMLLVALDKHAIAWACPCRK